MPQHHYEACILVTAKKLPMLLWDSLRFSPLWLCYMFLRVMLSHVQHCRHVVEPRHERSAGAAHHHDGVSVRLGNRADHLVLPLVEQHVLAVHAFAGRLIP